MTDSDEAKIIRSSRRTLSLEITPEARLIVRVPNRTSMETIKKVLFQKREWIRTRKEIIQRRSSERRERQLFFPVDKKWALEQIKGRVEWYAKSAGLRYASVKISNAKKRWGSCSSTGRLRFSWQLMRAPKDVIDYIVVHELAHLREMNHSKAFWAGVQNMFPAYQHVRTWLKKNQHSLND